MDLKLIVSVWGFLQVSGLTPEGCACKCATSRSMINAFLYFSGQFSCQPFDNPVNHWDRISHASVGAVNLCLMKSEMYLWLIISLIAGGEGVYGHFRENLLDCDWVDRCKNFSLLESAPFHSEWFPPQPTAFISSKEPKVKQEPKHFRLERREEFNKRSYHHKLEQSQRERNGGKKMYLTTGSETIAVINAVFLSTTFAEFILTWQTGIPTHSLQATKLIFSCMPPGELVHYKFEHYIFQIQRHDCSCDSPKHPEDQFTRD